MRFTSATQIPALLWFTREENRFAPPGDQRFPYVLTTYRLTEHHTGGGMSRFLPHLAELQPAMFAEISPELASSLGIKNGDADLSRHFARRN